MESVNHLTRRTLDRLLQHHQPPCISIYQPTSRHFPDNNVDSLQFKNLVKQAEEELKLNYRAREAQSLLDPLHALVHNRHFWNHQLDGLAVFRSAETHIVLRLPRRVPQFVAVAGTFHTKPLIRVLQTAGRYHVLCISQHHVSLYEGDRDSIEPVELRNVPRNIGECNLYDIRDGHVVRMPEATAVKHGQIGDPNESQDIVALDRFFRVVDGAITDQYSRPAGIPLILAAIEEYHDLFHRVSKNPNLLDNGIKVNPDSLASDRLRAEAWEIIQPEYHQRTRRLIDDFHVAKARQSAAEDVRQVVEAAASGRIAALLVDADKQVGGRINNTGKVHLADADNHAANDILDEAAEFVLKTGGQVMVIPHELMPTTTGVAAIYRY